VDSALGTAPFGEVRAACLFEFALRLRLELVLLTEGVLAFPTRGL
jgi:hypothetical protein